MKTNILNLKGFEKVRLLSEGGRTKVYLVRGDEGLQILKGEQPVAGEDAKVVLRRYERLKELSRGPGLMPILGCGVTEDGWVWHVLPLGDNLPGLPALETQVGIEQYTPMTLRTRTQEMGPAGARQVAEWGQRLCAGLELLHRGGLFHRNIQPANVVFVEGEPRLGDYSRIGETGSRVEAGGVDGFQPSQRGDDSSGDLHALGRTLYETWTGRDRMEYPSLSRRVLESPEWVECGLGLNEVILKSGEAVGKGGFTSAAEFGKALLEVGVGKRGVNRRGWLKRTVLAGLGVGAGVVILRGLRPVPRLHWDLVREEGARMDDWQGRKWEADWERRRMYSPYFAKDRKNIHLLNVDTYGVETIPCEGVDYQCMAMGWHPFRRSLILSSPKQDVLEWKPGVAGLKLLGGNAAGLAVGDAFYWNPVTRRIGTFGGYGNFRVRNGRVEFDIEKGEWVQVEADDVKKPIWPRYRSLTEVDEEGMVLYVLAGVGSPSGQQAKEAPGLPGFDGHFHVLDDVWRLDLVTLKWRQLLPPGMLGLNRAAFAFHDRTSDALVVVLRRELGKANPEPARAVMVDPARPGRYVELGMEGSLPGLGLVCGHAIDPKDGRLLVLTASGIYRVTIIRPA